MPDSIFIALLYNAALLVAMVLIFDLATSRYAISGNRSGQVLVGAILGSIGVGIMMAPFALAPGIVFDTRSVLLGMSGLFFGAIPTLVAVTITAAYRIWLGGAAAWTGVAVIVASGAIGYIWRRQRSRPLETIKPLELYALGLLVHLVLLALMLTLPEGAGPSVIATIGIPVMVIHPIATTVLGATLANRLRRDRTTRSLQDSELLYRSLVDSLPQNIYRIDRDGRITFANRVFIESLGMPADRLLGASIYDQYQPALAERFRATDTDVIEAGETLAVSEEYPDPLSGEIRHVEVIKTPIVDADGMIEGLQCVFSDITERKQAEARIHRLAFFDTLTGLPNRSLLMDRLTQRLASGRRTKRIEALILLNIDRFKVINDARGYMLGDALLAVFGARLLNLLREGDTLARMAGDEFAILLPDTADRRENTSRHALAVAEKIHAGLRQPFEVEGEEFALTVSLGITLLPETADESAEGILKRADTALHRAKAGGGDQTAFFDTVMGESATLSFRVERDLRYAIANRELELHLQSQVHAQRGIVGAEALVRWNHPIRGRLQPGAFIPIAEESSLIVQLGAWVLEEACRLIAQETRAGKPLRLSVNISPRHFRQRDFVPWLKGILADSGADPAYLTLEITEGLVIDNIADIAVKMDDLARLGIRFSIDDFGTGYSSLAYLKRLPIHELKIDKAFIQDAPSDPNDAALVETILAVASHLQLEVVAEGIETEAQADFLTRRAQVIHQGFFYGYPEPSEDWLTKRRSH